MSTAGREQHRDSGEYERAVDEWARVTERLSLVDPEPQLIAAACEIAERHALRALDAIHLATALLLAEMPVVVASWDRRLRAAALDAGLGLAPASDPPSGEGDNAPASGQVPVARADTTERIA